MREDNVTNLPSRSKGVSTLIGDIISNFESYLPQRKRKKICSQHYTPLSPVNPVNPPTVCYRLHDLQSSESNNINILDEESIFDTNISTIISNDYVDHSSGNNPTDIFKDI